MPFGIRRQGKKYQVVNRETGRVLGEHASMKAAQAQMAAVMSSMRRKGTT